MIRVLLQLAVLLVLVGLPVGLVWALLSRDRSGQLTGRDRQQAIEGATWQAYTDVRPTGTAVGIRKVIAGRSAQDTVGEMVLAEIATDEPDWEVALSQALLAARIRADVLNTEEGRGA